MSYKFCNYCKGGRHLIRNLDGSLRKCPKCKGKHIIKVKKKETQDK